MKPSIWVYALCYNEIHFIRNFFAAYKDADKITIYDSNSTDGSTQVAEELGATVIQIDTGDQLRDDIFIDIKNKCWKEARGKADWVIVCDLDEIFTRIVMTDGVVTYDLDLSVPFDGGFDVIKPYGYNMIGDAPSFTGDHPFIHSQNGARHPPAEKLCCFRPDRIAEINYSPGCHSANPVAVSGEVSVFYDRDYKALHYLGWNRESFVLKMERGRGRLSDINKQNGWGYQYLNTKEQNEGMFDFSLKNVVYLFDILP